MFFPITLSHKIIRRKLHQIRHLQREDLRRPVFHRQHYELDAKQRIVEREQEAVATEMEAAGTLFDPTAVVEREQEAKEKAI